MDHLQLEHLKCTKAENGVVTALLDRPPLNALNRQVLEELAILFEYVRNEESVRAVVLAGAGPNFAAGADIKEIESLPPGDAVERFSHLGMDAFDKIEHLRVPVIAAIKGYCLGGGNELAMATHFRVADAEARFGQPEIKLGICPGFGATQRLPRLIGEPQALRLLLTGETITAQEAHALGLADIVLRPGEDALAQARKIADSIAQCSGLIAASIMELVVEGNRLPIKQGLRMESKAFGDLSKTQDMREGFKAFIEKRQPRFTERWDDRDFTT